jgi:hypothetical protein
LKSVVGNGLKLSDNQVRDAILQFLIDSLRNNVNVKLVAMLDSQTFFALAKTGGNIFGLGDSKRIAFYNKMKQLSQCKMVLFPIHIQAQHHWVLGIALIKPLLIKKKDGPDLSDPLRKQVEIGVFDTLSTNTNPAIAPALREIHKALSVSGAIHLLADKSLPISTPNIKTYQPLYQGNGIDCGVWVYLQSRLLAGNVTRDPGWIDRYDALKKLHSYIESYYQQLPVPVIKHAREFRDYFEKQFYPVLNPTCIKAGNTFDNKPMDRLLKAGVPQEINTNLITPPSTQAPPPSLPPRSSSTSSCSSLAPTQTQFLHPPTSPLSGASAISSSSSPPSTPPSTSKPSPTTTQVDAELASMEFEDDGTPVGWRKPAAIEVKPAAARVLLASPPFGSPSPSPPPSESDPIFHPSPPPSESDPIFHQADAAAAAGAIIAVPVSLAPISSPPLSLSSSVSAVLGLPPSPPPPSSSSLPRSSSSLPPASSTAPLAAVPLTSKKVRVSKPKKSKAEDKLEGEEKKSKKQKVEQSKTEKIANRGRSSSSEVGVGVNEEAGGDGEEEEGEEDEDGKLRLNKPRSKSGKEADHVTNICKKAQKNWENHRIVTIIATKPMNVPPSGIDPSLRIRIYPNDHTNPAAPPGFDSYCQLESTSAALTQSIMRMAEVLQVNKAEMEVMKLLEEKDEELKKKEKENTELKARLAELERNEVKRMKM